MQSKKLNEYHQLGLGPYAQLYLVCVDSKMPVFFFCLFFWQTVMLSFPRELLDTTFVWLTFLNVSEVRVKVKPLSPLCCAVAGRVSPSTLACPPVDSGSPTPPTSPAPPHTPGTVAAEQPRQQPKQLRVVDAAWTPVCSSRPAGKSQPAASGLQTGPPVQRSACVPSAEEIRAKPS